MRTLPQTEIQEAGLEDLVFALWEHDEHERGDDGEVVVNDPPVLNV